MNAARLARSMAALVLVPAVAVLASCEPVGDGPGALGGSAATVVAPAAAGPRTESGWAHVGADAPGAPPVDLVAVTGVVAVAGATESAPTTTGAPTTSGAPAPATTAVRPTAPATTAAPAPPAPAPRSPAPATTAPTAAAAPTTAPPATTRAVPPAKAASTVAGVGDSIMLAAKPRLEALPGWNVTIDAVVGRQFSTGIPLLATAAASGAGTVVLGLGTNGPVSDAMFDAAMRNLAGVPRVVVVTVQLPDASYPHERPTNDVLRRGAARWGAVVADWNVVSAGRTDAFAPDGYHLSGTGMQLYVSMLADALARAAAGPGRA